MTNPNTHYAWRSLAPANSMILGEHSVVYGHPALACALSQFITIDWRIRDDQQIVIHSELANHITSLQTLEDHPKLRFVLAAIKAYQPYLKTGLTLDITSEFSSTIGLGSSAAVLAATLHGLATITQQDSHVETLFSIGHRIILAIQGRGSGTDLAASLSGGMIYFQPATETHPNPAIEKLMVEGSLLLLYAGYKTPTAEVLELVAEQWKSKPETLHSLYQQMANTTRHAYHQLQALRTPENGQMLNLNQSSVSSTNDFYQACSRYQELMTELGVNDVVLTQIIESLEQCGQIHGVKISGSGLGDCVMAFGQLSLCQPNIQQQLAKYPQLNLPITMQGACTNMIVTTQ